MKQPSFNHHPAHLWIGSNTDLIEKVETALQQFFCPNQHCKKCSLCLQVLERQHASVLWISPEKNYTIDELEPVFRHASFTLQPNEHFFFVLEKADFFNQSCANALLKIVEEPPPGYHFILLAERSEYIVPTIRSRCLITEFSHVVTQETKDICTWFKQLNVPDPATFWQTIEKSPLSDRESLELLDDLLVHWSDAYKTSSDNKKKQTAEKMIVILKACLEQAPMPGSSKIFWRDLYLKILFL